MLSGKLNDPTVIVAPGRSAAGVCADEPCPPVAVHAAHSTASASPRKAVRRTAPRSCILSSCACWHGQASVNPASGIRPSTGGHRIFLLRQIKYVGGFLPVSTVDNGRP